MKVRWKTITLGFLASLGVILYLHPNIDLKARHFKDSLFTNTRDAIDLPSLLMDHLILLPIEMQEPYFSNIQEVEIPLICRDF